MVYEPVVTPFDWTCADFEAAVSADTLRLLEARAAQAQAARAKGEEQGEQEASPPDDVEAALQSLSLLSEAISSPTPSTEPSVAVAAAPGVVGAVQRAASVAFDVILLTDCIFSVSLVGPLVDILRHYSAKGTTVYCCHEIRDADANALFVAELAKYFRVKRITHNKLHPDYRSKFIQVLQAKLLRN
jgi:hypothetical protein